MVPCSTPGQGEAAPELGRAPRPAERRSREQRRKEGQTGSGESSASKERGEGGGEAETSLPGRAKARIAHVPKTLIPTLSVPQPAHTRSTSAASTDRDSDTDLMDFTTPEVKKRQSDSGGGRKALKKSR